MAAKSFSGNMAEIISTLRSYFKARLELWKLSLLEKTSLAGSFFLSYVIVLVIAAIVLLFLSFGFAYWFGQSTGNLANGFLITAGFYVVLGIIFILSWKYLITKPIIRKFAAIIYKDDKHDEMDEI
jgi:hypothetical protein